jgi:hypothetical protein
MSSGDALKLSNQRLRAVVLAVLRKRPNHSCKRDDLVGEVLRKLGVRAMRGTPRANFRKNLNQAVGVLKRVGYVQEYQATNVRLRLARPSRA